MHRPRSKNATAGSLPVHSPSDHHSIVTIHSVGADVRFVLRRVGIRELGVARTRGAPAIRCGNQSGARLLNMRAEPVSLDPNPVIEAYKKDVDRTLLRENLKLTPDERLRKLQDFVEFLMTLRGAGRSARP